MGNYYAGMMNATGGSELRHHGILGQKWGVRRFQNKDGSYTEEGKKRYWGGSKLDTSFEQKKVVESMSSSHDTKKFEKTASYKDSFSKALPFVKDAIDAEKKQSEVYSKNRERFFKDSKRVNEAFDSLEKYYGEEDREIFDQIKMEYDYGYRNPDIYDAWLYNNPSASEKKEWDKLFAEEVKARDKMKENIELDAREKLGEYANKKMPQEIVPDSTFLEAYTSIIEYNAYKHFRYY